MRLICLLMVLALSGGAALAEDAPFASFDKASEPVLNDPHDVKIGPDGMLYVADKFGGRIVVMDPETLEISHVLADGLLPGVHDVDFAADGSILTAVTGAGRALLLNAEGTEILHAMHAPQTEGALAHSNGNYYVTSAAFGAIILFEGDVPVKMVEGGHFGVHDIEEGPDGTIWIADTGGRKLVEYSADLELLQVLDDPKYGFLGPRYLDVDDFGRIVVADQDAHRVLLIDPKGAKGGAILGVLGDGRPGLGPNKFDDPEGVEIFGNQYFFADSDNNRIVRYSVVTN